MRDRVDGLRVEEDALWLFVFACSKSKWRWRTRMDGDTRRSNCKLELPNENWIIEPIGYAHHHRAVNESQNDVVRL